MIRKEARIFLVVGTLTVLVDFLVYHLFLWVGGAYALAKATGFIGGTIFAYFVNRRWTFGHTQHLPNSAVRFALLYAATLGANVIINAGVLKITLASPWGVHIAFLVATGVSALLNFFGMKFFVFKHRVFCRWRQFDWS